MSSNLPRQAGFAVVALALTVNVSQGELKKVTPVNQTKAHGRLLLIDFTSGDRWFNYNNWKGKLTYRITPDRTPTGAPAQHFEITEVEPGVVNINAFFEWGDLPQDISFGEVCLWMKGDGSGRVVRLSLDAKGKNLIRHHHRLFSTTWEPVRLRLPLSAPGRVSVRDINTFTVNVRGSCRFSIGEVALRLGHRHLPLREHRKLVAPRLASSPALDGDLSDPAWRQAGQGDSFLALGSTTEPATHQTETRVGYDSQSIHIAARLRYPDTSKIRSTFERRDDHLYNEDDFEVFLDNNKPATEFCASQLIVSPKAVLFDMKHFYDVDAVRNARSIPWNGEWSARTRVLRESLDMEIRIPFSDLEISAGSRPYVRFQMARTNITDREYSSWSPTSKFPQRGNFGILVFGREHPARVRVHDVTLTEHKAGEMYLFGNLELLGRDEADAVVQATFTDAHRNQHTYTHRLAVDRSVTPFFLPVPMPSVSEGKYKLGLVVDQGPQVTPAVAEYDFDVVVPLNVKYGEIALNPAPKEVRWGQGAMKLEGDIAILVPASASDRTRKTAQFLQQDLRAYTGARASVRSWDGSAPGPGTLLLATQQEAPGPMARAAHKVERLSDEGYYLNVRPKQGILLGKGDAGLYYAVITLMQILRAPRVQVSGPQIPCVEILDWPDLAWRVNAHQSAGYSRRKTEVAHLIAHPDEKMSMLKELVKDFVAGNKLNVLTMSLDQSFAWRKHPKLQYNAFLNAQELGELASFCREHFVELIPGINPSGHNPYFIYRAMPELRMPDDRMMADISRPEYAELVRDLLDELVAACKPKFVSVGHDELWHRPKGKQLTHRNGIPRKEIFYRDLMNMYEHLRKKGVRMLMYGDMLIRAHHGNRFDCYEVAGRLPNDIVIHNWSTGVKNGVEELRKAGFTLIADVVNGFRPVPQHRGLIQGFGTITYSNFLYTTLSYTADTHGVNYCYHGLLRGADYAWNFAVDTQLPVEEWRRRNMLNLMPVYASKANPAAGQQYRPVSLAASANETFRDVKKGDGKGWFDLGPQSDLSVLSEGAKSLGLLPVDLTASADGNQAVVLRKGGKPVEIAVPPSCASLVFLHTCHYPKETKKAWRDFRRRGVGFIRGIPIGQYRVEYEDGTKVSAPILYGRNILEWTPYPPARFLPACRYVWERKLGAGQLGCLFQYEWVNPHPEKGIRSLVIERGDTEADLALVALTARDVAP